MSHVSVEQYHDFNQNNVLLAFFKASFIYRFPMKFKVYFTCLKFHAWDFSKACILYLRDCKTIVMAFVMTLELLHIEKNPEIQEHLVATTAV